MSDLISTIGLNFDSSSVRTASRDLRDLVKNGQLSEAGLSSLTSAWSVVRTAVSSYLALDVARQVAKQADAYASLTARLSLVTNGTSNLATVQAQLFDVSQRTRVGVEQTTDLYATLARATKPLGVAQRDLVAVTESINKALIVSGANSQSASAALVQLGQGFGSGVLRGEELNSVMEQTPRLAQAIADGLGVPLGALRRLGEQGELTADKVFNALKKAGDSIEREFSRLPPTVGGALTQIQNSTLKLIGTFDKATGATSALASVMSAAAAGIADVAREIENADEVARDFSSAAGVILTAVETLKVLGSDVAFVFKGIGTEIGGIAAQLAALSRGDFKGFAAIGEQMKADAEAARKALDDYQKGVLKGPQGKALKADTSVDDAETARLGRYESAALQLERQRQARAEFLKDFATDSEKFNAELKKQKAALGSLFTPADQKRIYEKFFPKIASSELDLGVDKIKSALEVAQAAYKNSESELEAQRSVGLVSLEDYYAERARLIAKDLQAQIDAYEKENSLLEADQKKRGVKSPEGIADAKKIAENNAKIEQATAQAVSNLKVLDIQGGSAIRNLAKGYDEARLAAQQFYEELVRGQQREIAMIGMTDRERQRAQGRAQIEDKYEAERRRIRNERALLEQQQPEGLRDDQRKRYSEQLALQDEFERMSLQSYEASVDKRLEQEGRWQIGASRAIANYVDNVSNSLKQTESAYANIFGSLEDTLTQFIKTGKLNFKSLADTIISELARVEARKIAANLSGSVGSLLGTAFGALLGGGSGSGIGNAGAGDYKGYFDGLAGGRAIGGPVSAGMTYQVNERDIPEIARVGGRDYLTMGGQGGKVIPLNQSSLGPNVTIHVGAGVTRGELVALIPQLTEQIKASLKGDMARPYGRA